MIKDATRQERGRLAESRGKSGESRVAAVLLSYGRTVSRARMRQGIAAEPFDLLVDGKPIEVKTSIPQLDGNGSKRTITVWRFNIHRHSVLKEQNLFGYILRFDDFPGTRSALHMFFKAPLRRKVMSISLSSILKKPEYYHAVQDFYRLARGELN